MIHISLGFVTNSSATTHLMAWNGSKEDLRAILEAHRTRFPTSFVGWPETYHVTADEIIDALVSCLPKAEEAAQFRAQTEARLAYAQQQLQRRNDVLPAEIAREEIYEAEHALEKAADRDWVLQVGFGDSDGDFAGGALGNVMDYEGRHISIQDDRLAYWTEQDR